VQALHFRRWVLEYDATATSAAYAAARPIGPEQCGCLYCRNFIAARDRSYPSELRQLASTVGVIPLTETETFDNGPLELSNPNVRLGGGFFHFVGRIVHDPAVADEDIYFLTERSLLPEAFGDQPVVQVEFSFPVPWVVEEPPPV
jgi:hypothetical protein